jgi:hypothetical protein
MRERGREREKEVNQRGGISLSYFLLSSKEERKARETLKEDIVILISLNYLK